MSDSSFDRKAQDYDKKKRRLELAAAVVSSLTSLPFTKKMTALEFGCGTGLIGTPLAHRFAHLTCVDTSDGMLTVLREKIAKSNLSNIKVLHRDITQAPLDDKFDVIFCSMVLHHVEKLDNCLKTLCNHLNKGGILAIADLDEEDGSFHSSSGSDFLHQGFNRTDFKKKLESFGFSDIKFSTVHTIFREDKNGVEQPYTVFLLSSRRQ